MNDIIIDDNLKRLGDEFFSHVEEFGIYQNNFDVECIATIIKDKELPDFIELKWSNENFSLQERNKIKCPNNLDSVLRYIDPVTAPFGVVFGVLECVRKHMKADNIYLVGNTQKKTFVCIDK
jgi:hypothetical protein